MLLTIPDADAEQVRARARACSTDATGLDGRVTAGPQSARVKDNLPAAGAITAARASSATMILGALQRNPLFMSAALPLRVFPPLFNQLSKADSRSATTSTTPSARSPARRIRIRTDALGHALPQPARTSTTAASFDVEDTYGVHAVKLPAGHMVLYPSTSLHHVTAGHARRADRVVLLDSEHGARRRGSARCSSISTPRSSGERGGADHPAAVQLTGVYHNLLRRWAEV